MNINISKVERFTTISLENVEGVSNGII